MFNHPAVNSRARLSVRHHQESTIDLQLTHDFIRKPSGGGGVAPAAASAIEWSLKGRCVSLLLFAFLSLFVFL